jgi:hypothetical protein
MTRNDYLALMQRALAEPHGLRLSFPDRMHLIRAARTFYKLREEVRRIGDKQFDILSICRPRRPKTELLLFSRARIDTAPVDDGLEATASPLSATDMPRRIRDPHGPRSREPRPPLWMQRQP